MNSSLEESLWLAAGSPPWDAAVPAAASPQWRAVRAALQRSLARAASASSPPRSPAALYSRLHSEAPPRGFTWGQLFRHLPLRAALSPAPDAAGGLRLASWNVRWLTSHATPVGERKLRLIRRWLAAGRIVALQETHWDDPTAARWGALLSLGRLVHSAGPVGPTGRPSGGVAVLLPAAAVLEGSRVHVPGAALEVSFSLPGRPRPCRLLNLYLPASQQEAVLRAALDGPAVRADEDPFLCGDLNFPRGDSEEAPSPAAVSFQRLLDRWRAADLTVGRPTRREPGAVASAIDLIACPARDSADVRVSLTWLDGLSDHAACFLDPQPPARRRGAAWTAETMRRLPDAAHHDLRRVWHSLQLSLKVHLPSDLCARPLPPRPARVGEEPPDSALPPPDPDPSSTHFGPHLVLARFGLPFISAALHDWWRRWRRARAPLEDEVAGDLRRCASAARPAPLPATRQWLATAGWAGPLSTADAKRWLTVRLRTLAAAEAHLPVLLGGPRGAALPTLQGRALLRPQARIQSITLPDGSPCDGADECARHLWRSRDDLWGTRAPHSPAASSILDAYFSPTRQATVPREAPTDASRLVAVVLQAAGAAPGVDGIPYEAYHRGRTHGLPPRPGAPRRIPRAGRGGKRHRARCRPLPLDPQSGWRLPPLPLRLSPPAAPIHPSPPLRCRRGGSPGPPPGAGPHRGPSRGARRPLRAQPPARL